VRSPEALDGDHRGSDFARFQNSREKLKNLKHIAVFVLVKAYTLVVGTTHRLIQSL
jgi:hypothetical protein